jgi:hypothetical protein
MMHSCIAGMAFCRRIAHLTDEHQLTSECLDFTGDSAKRQQINRNPGTESGMHTSSSTMITYAPFWRRLANY